MKALKVASLVILLAGRVHAEAVFPEDNSVANAKAPKVMWIDGLAKDGANWKIDVSHDWEYIQFNNTAFNAKGQFDTANVKAWGCYAETCGTATRKTEFEPWTPWTKGEAGKEYTLVGIASAPGGPEIPGSPAAGNGAVQWVHPGSFKRDRTRLDVGNNAAGPLFWTHAIDPAAKGTAPEAMASACKSLCMDVRAVPWKNTAARNAADGRFEYKFNPPVTKNAKGVISPTGKQPVVSVNRLKKVKFPDGTEATPINCRLGWNWDDFE